MRKTPLSEDEVRSIFQMIVKGVDACHQKGIMHCDLKLDNILLNVDSSNKISDLCIADFGLSSEI